MILCFNAALSRFSLNLAILRCWWRFEMLAHTAPSAFSCKAYCFLLSSSVVRRVSSCSRSSLCIRFHCSTQAFAITRCCCSVSIVFISVSRFWISMSIFVWLAFCFKLFGMLSESIAKFSELRLVQLKPLVRLATTKASHVAACMFVCQLQTFVADVGHCGWASHCNSAQTEEESFDTRLASGEETYI